MASASLKDLFAQAVELAPDQRRAFLDARCAGTPDLRSQLESLLDAHDRSRSFLDDPTISRARFASVHPEQIGPYRILQLIGEGGFGTVYTAEQLHPVRRTVALKVIKPGMDSRQVIARFEAERQALAIMDHPNIAKVFDAGTTDAGRPYFVMELVDGVPITAFCDQHRLGPRHRLELFALVCDAVQHAHHKGIIHRDLKPTNVLVALRDGSPAPKVIDFGVAMATHGPLTDHTRLTEQRQMIGTPQYMPPEQAEVGAADIDTRADVYCLGVLLYELLTGTTPFEPIEPRTVHFAEIQRLIREAEPPRPSARLSSLGEKLPAVAALRQSDPRRLAALVRGELDWVVMKCLEKDRGRRYETAAALAADVRRYLAGDTVLARPVSGAYRVRKFVRRHKVWVAATGAVAAALVLGVLGTSTGMVRARRAQRDAERATRDAVAERAAAERNAQDTRRQTRRAAAVGEFMRQTFALAQPESGPGGGPPTVVELLKLASTRVEVQLDGQVDDQVVVRSTLADAFLRLQEPDLAVEQLRLAHDLSEAQSGGQTSPQTLGLAADLVSAMYVAGRGEDAVPLATQTHQRATAALGNTNPVTWKATNALALALSTVGRGRESHALWADLVTRLRPLPDARSASYLGRYLANLTASLQDQGKSADALAAMREAGQIMRETAVAAEGAAALPPPTGGAMPIEPLLLIGRSSPDVIQSNAWMARLMVEAGQVDQVLPLVEKYVGAALLFYPQGTTTLTDRMIDIACMKLLSGDRPGAARWFGRAVETGHRLRPSDTEQDESRWRQWAMSCSDLTDGWKSETLADHVWCALDDLLRDFPPQDLAPTEVDLEGAKFKLFRWDTSGDGSAALVAEGGANRLKALPEPQPGLYLLGLEVPRPAGAPLRRACWFPVAPWKLAFHPIPRFESVRTHAPARWAEKPITLNAEPYEQRSASGLALDDVLSLARRRVGRIQWFGAVARTRLDLPAGTYRFSASSDDGVRVWVDDRLVIDHWTAQPSLTCGAQVRLDGGAHDLRVEFFQEVGGYHLWLQVAPLTPSARDAAAALGGGVPELDSLAVNLLHGPALHPQSANPAFDRAQVLARAGRFDEAAAAFDRLLRDRPSDWHAWHEQARVLACAGDAAAYRAHCLAMLDRFASSTEPSVCQDLLIDCAACPGPQATAPQLAAARATLDRIASPTPAIRLALALHDLRAGHDEAAAESLRAAAESFPADQPFPRATAAQFAAIAARAAGRADEALTLFHSADSFFTTRCPRAHLDDPGPAALDAWLLSQTARREAGSLFDH